MVPAVPPLHALLQEDGHPDVDVLQEVQDAVPGEEVLCQGFGEEELWLRT